MSSSSVSVLKFVGTVSLGLLTGVSYTVSTLALPTVLNLPSASSASHALTTLTSYLRLPILTLSTLASAPLLISFVLSPRSARHPYLVYTSLLAILSSAAPSLLPRAAAVTSRQTRKPRDQKLSAAASARAMEQSYEVLGDAPISESHSDNQSEEEMIDDGGYNGEEVRAEVEGAARSFAVRTGLAALGFAMAVVGIWGDGAPQAVVYVS